MLDNSNNLTHQDRWILGELNAITKKINQSLEEYRFDDACSAIYQFTYEKFCSWYIEFSKPILYGGGPEQKVIRATTLNYCLKKIMALLHPIAPFISEEIWQYIKNDDDPLLIVTDYPECDTAQLFEQDRLEMNQFIEMVTKARNLRQSVNLPLKQEIDMVVFTDHQSFGDYLKENAVFLFNLARVKNLRVHAKSADRPQKSIAAATSFCEIFIPLEGVIDLQEQIARLKKEMAKTEKELNKFQDKLANEKFLNKAPQEVIFETREKAEKYQQQLDGLRKNLALFQV